jgi:hypothetical protein
MSEKKVRPQHAYLLRCWQEGECAEDQVPLWRFSVEEILHKGPRRGFDSLEALIDFLRMELADKEPRPMPEKRLKPRL